MYDGLKPMKKVDLAFAWETIQVAMAGGLEDLIALHDEEVAFPDQPPLEIDWPVLLTLERQGRYRSVSARLGSSLIGYRSFFIEHPVNHKSLLWAINHALYIDPEHRRSRAGPMLIRESDRMLKTLGVQIVLQADRSVSNLSGGKAHATLGDLLRRQGYAPMEVTHAKRL